MVRSVVLAAALALSACPALASEWELVQGESRLGFVATQNGKEFTGEFTKFAADIVFDPEALDISKATVVILTESIETTFPDDQDQAARGKDWFYSSKFPKATFETLKIRKTGENSYAADSRLTIRHVTKHLTLPFTLDISGDTARMKGEVTINRGDFGVGQGQFAKGKWFGMDVRVVVDVTAKRKK